MKRAAALIAIILVSLNQSGQFSVDRSNVPYPVEVLKVHVTQKILFPGEVIGFKIYCSNALFPELELSRVAFIELVNERNAPILRKKILLVHGTGEGEFVLPLDLASGIYTILSYTNWLKNFGEESFSRIPVAIVNPDQGLARCSDTTHCHHLGPPRTKTNDHSSDGLSLRTDKKLYHARERVSLQVKLDPDEPQHFGGSFSVSVCYTEPALYREDAPVREERIDRVANEVKYLPDFRGIRLSGTLEDAFGTPMPGSMVMLSEPGPGTHISSAVTDGQGNFHFLLDPHEGEKDLVFTLPVSDAMLKLEEPFWNGLKDTRVQGEICLTDTAVSFLEEKYYHFQLQEKFNRPTFVKRQHLVTNGADSTVFYTSPSRLLRMDDFILLDSLPEYFYELIPFVKFIQSRGKSEIRVTEPLSGMTYGEKPGVFLDGVLYGGTNEIAKIPVYLIDKIAVIPEIYYYGHFTFGGIIDLHTKDSDFNAVRLLPDMIRLIFSLASKSEMKFDERVVLSPDSTNRLPDFRPLICWEPDFTIGETGENTIDFYTGDLMGDFTVMVTGISPEGKLFQSETKIAVGQ